MYGDTEVMRRRVSQLREQGSDIRATADHLVGHAEQISWVGRAADAMRERVRDRAAQLRECAGHHDGAADALELHLQSVADTADTIAQIERTITELVAEARTRVARIGASGDPDGVERADADRQLLGFTPPPSGHRDWLSVELPGL